MLPCIFSPAPFPCSNFFLPGPIVADKNCEKIHYIGTFTLFFVFFCLFLKSKLQKQKKQRLPIYIPTIQCAAYTRKYTQCRRLSHPLSLSLSHPTLSFSFSFSLSLSLSLFPLSSFSLFPFAPPPSHFIPFLSAPNIYCCGAGTAADTEMTTALISSQLELLRMRTGTQSRVVTCMTILKRFLYKHQGQISAALVLGGVDITGPHLYTIYPHGSTDKLPFVTMGSGSLAAMSVFESGYKDSMTEVEAKKLVRDAIAGGVFNDLGSGSNIDLTVIRTPTQAGPGGELVDILRGYETPNNQGDLRSKINRPAASNIPRGATNVKSSMFVPVRERVNVVDVNAEGQKA